MATSWVTASNVLSGWSVRRWLEGAARWLTTPATPDDYLGLVDPLWPSKNLCGRVEDVRSETADTATLVIRPGSSWVPHRAGQWVKIGVDIEGVRHWRTYSLSSPPGRSDGCITITVKAIPDGLVSRHLVRETSPGTILCLSRPEGAFVLPDPLPSRLLFFTAGSGITPVMSMLQSLMTYGTGTAGGAGLRDRCAPQRTASRLKTPDVVLMHSAPTPEDVIFGEELRGLAARYPNLWLYERHTRIQGRIKPTDLPELCPDWTERVAWACGPTGMLDEVTAHWTRHASRLHVERFHTEVSAAGEAGHVRFIRSRREADADGGTPLLAVGEHVGVLMPSGCRMGICYGCVARLSRGQVRDLRTGRIHGEEGDLVQTCVSAAVGAVEIEL